MDIIKNEKRKTRKNFKMKIYYTLDQLINLIEYPNRRPCQKIYSDNKRIFNKSKGSKKNHQAWKGGYIGHITDIMNIAFLLYPEMDYCRELPFTLSDALLVLYLHDIEKPWKYAGNEQEQKELESYSDYQEFQKAKIKEYDFQLTDDHWNALQYAHGEGDDFKNTERVSKPLAAFIHCCDTMGARIWFDYPKKSSW